MRYHGPEAEILHERYARALFGVAEESESIDDVCRGLEALSDFTRKEKNFLKVMTHPKIGKKDKMKILENTSRKTHFPSGLLYFLKVLVKNNRAGLMHGIFLKFKDFYEKKKEIKKVFVKTAESLGKKNIERLREALSRSLKKDIAIEESVDPSIIGGFDIEIGGTVYKNSLASSLAAFRNKLTSL